ncbi:DNA-binding PadR family transcriptional regulator [Spinactinospora alkalitolerans]|uniref:DNA-binding PadR family transcriptional regulator n=1 Tax=Spinactinospora alkalitolerans TaxID=687207 RepID=A0A852TR81_9ACTN|nr:helix-turn-helix transcriptional regulator [Spinactinospora alkalitolerans]NYE45807.1 DNA-binding PadR family transcriptional regulator [Spinactinospora alkalitolerans]
MSTIFGHGRLRLYLLKLLDESPRHGYEIISLLRDRFLGVYSPSPGTIYPRLARLEEEGLVSHEEVNGRKVYRLTDKGREELRSRGGDLDDLEREITDSVRDVARAVKQDVRDTIGSLREELKFAAGDTRRQSKAGPKGAGDVWGEASTEDSADSEEARREREHAGSGRTGGSWWERDWEKVAHGFSAWGSSWSRHGRGEERTGPDVERALRDFSGRVRAVVREAGQVGESAATDLRRILDETVEAIRRDARTWGPPGSEEAPGGRSGDAASGTGTRDGGGESAKDTGAESAKPERTPEESAAGGTGHGPFAQPPAGTDTGDPWDSAIREDRERREHGDGPGSTA